MSTNDAEPQLDAYYGNLRNYVKMVTGGYSNLLMLDAKGGLGKSHNVLETLSEHADDWVHQKGFTTPIELFKTLFEARRRDTVLFLDDMSGVTGNTKAIDMLKSATDTEGDENVVQYRTSQDIEHPTKVGLTLPNTFTFRGRVIMSFNQTPDNHHFNALKDRGTYYQMSFSYDERIDIIKEIAKSDEISSLPISVQRDTADWIESATNPTYDVTIRTFEEVLKMREFGRDTGQNWKEMALEVFNIDYRKHRIIEMRQNMDMPVSEQVETWCDEFDLSESQYYDEWDAVREEFMA